ncbi:MAG TPA: PQQ-binding-like beta-propeller repeat protein [Patescibacteria group bacterium]|nr:PQQ-binding-like beta-propeller repeat protein [Patescibacteria group bacterium]
MKRITGLFLVFFFISMAPPAFAGAQPARSAVNQAASAPKKPVAKDEMGDNWPDADRGPKAMRFNPLTQITPENAAQLGKVCSYTFPAKEPAESAPVVWDGVVYATSAHYTVALDGSNCHVKWLDHWKPRGIERSEAQRGVAYADGKLVRGTPDDYLIEMNAENGHVIWARQIANPHQGYFISMSPLVYDGLIYVGPAGAEMASSGWVGAFKLSDGALVWKFHVVPLNGQPGAETWGPNPAARAHGGGNSWTEYGLDPARGLLYVPGGNAAPDFYSQGRPGANLYTNSLIALDAKTGHLAWYHQFIPHDTHDYDTTHATPIFEAKIDGKKQPLVASTGKDGVLRVLNRDTHQMIYSVPFAKQVNSRASLTTKPTHVCPGSLGGQEWNGSGYNPRLNLLIVQSIEWCETEWAASEKPSVKFAHTKGLYFGGGMKPDPWPEAGGRVTAFDASTGKVVWRHQTPEPMVGGVALTANLVFTGELTGNFDVLNARTGKILYQYQLHDPVEGGVATYLASGRQYVAVVSGAGAVYNHVEPQIGGGNPTVTVFGLKQK